MTTAAPSTTDLYALLLGLAGRISDEALAEMRLCLADAEVADLAAGLAAEIGSGRLSLTEPEAALVRDLFEEWGIDQDVTVRPQEAPPYRFGDEYGTTMPTGDGWGSQKDAMDAVAVEAGERVGGLIAIWRVFRHAHEGPARRVYLAEAKARADAAAELTAETQYALTEASEDTPRVEIFAEGTLLPAYHDLALAAATLIWAVEDTPVRLARAFDGASEDDGPYFADDHPRLDGPEREQVLAYLRDGEPVLDTPGALDDVFDGRLGKVPVGFRSDGRWVWPDAVAYYLEHHGLAPEPDLVAHVLARSGPPDPLNRLTRHRVLTTLFAPTGGEPVWQAG